MILKKSNEKWADFKCPKCEGYISDEGCADDEPELEHSGYGKKRCPHCNELIKVWVEVTWNYFAE